MFANVVPCKVVYANVVHVRKCCTCIRRFWNVRNCRNTHACMSPTLVMNEYRSHSNPSAWMNRPSGWITVGLYRIDVEGAIMLSNLNKHSKCRTMQRGIVTDGFPAVFNHSNGIFIIFRIAPTQILMFFQQWRNYRPRSPRNAGGPDEKGAQNFKTTNLLNGRFLFGLGKLNITP